MKPLLFFLSLVIVALAQPDLSLIACVVASACGYALFWKGVQGLSKKKIFTLSMGWFALVLLVHFSWFLADRYVGFYIYFFLLFLIGTLAACFGALTVLLQGPLSVTKALALAAGWTLFEWSRLFFLSGFTWDPVGLPLTGTLYGMQMVTLLGIFGCTFWVIFVNILALRTYKISGKIAWALCAAAPYLFGYYHLEHHKDKIGDKTHTALLVQTSIYPEKKARFPGIEGLALTPWEQWGRILALLKPYDKAAIDLIVLPESTVPYGTDFPIFGKGEAHQFFRTFFPHFRGKIPTASVGNAYFAAALASHFNAEVVIGLDDYEQEGAYNSAFVFHPNGTRERYEKRVLVPMGEYIPFAFCKKILKKWGIEDSFTAGRQAKVFESRCGRIGTSICYEETFGHLMRQTRQKGAEVFVNLTNDVWYPHSRLPTVHYAHGKLRAVENGIPLVRACNTGVTCAVDSFGREVSRLIFEKKGQAATTEVLKVTFPTYTYATLYTFWGDKAVVLSSVLFVLVYAAERLIALRKKTRYTG